MRSDRVVRIISRAWRGRRGWVFLPWIDGTARTKAQRRRGFHEGRAFRWPDDRKEIERHVHDHTGDDLYWCPTVFRKRKRVSEFAYPDRCLWADMDEVDPLGVDHRPTIAWRTSPDRWQGLWLLMEEHDGASAAGGINQRLTYALGADPSGWDTTQLLRVPGWINHKPEYADKEGRRGELMWSDGPVYDADDLDGVLPEAPGIGSVDPDMAEDLLEGIDRRDVWRRVRLGLPSRVRQLMAARESAGDRSEILWSIERDLADAGCTVPEIVSLVRATVWNKYEGRADELKRLVVEATKAVEEANRGVPEESGVEEVEEVRHAWDIATHVEPPDWLVSGVWAEGAVGFVAGAPKSYKSWLALDMAVSVATGTDWVGHPVRHPGGALVVQAEDPMSMVSHRLRTVIQGKVPHLHPWGQVALERGERGGVVWAPPGAVEAPQGEPELSLPPLWLAVRNGFDASDDGWQAWLADEVRDRDIKLVVIDTLLAASGGVDLDRGHEVMDRVLVPLKVIAEETGAAVCVVHHVRKAEAMRRGTRMLGSVAMHAWLECAVHVETMEGGVVAELESKHVEAREMALDVGVENQGWYAREMKGGPANGQGGGLVVKKLGDMGGRASVGLLAQQCGMDERTVKAELTVAQTSGLVTHDSAGKWELT